VLRNACSAKDAPGVVRSTRLGSQRAEIRGVEVTPTSSIPLLWPYVTPLAWFSNLRRDDDDSYSFPKAVFRVSWDSQTRGTSVAFLLRDRRGRARRCGPHATRRPSRTYSFDGSFFMKNKIVLTPILAAITILACGSNRDGNESPGGGPDNPMASVSFNLAGATDFANQSVRICGSRPAPDSKYRCDASIALAGSSACPCFNFTADGNLVDSTGAPVVLDGLCPTSDFPSAIWTFQYDIFSEPNCEGTHLNDGTHDLTCFDSHDLGTQAFPNQSVEVLYPGRNQNHIMCVTSEENASKSFQFLSCADTTTPADVSMDQIRFDCGCVPMPRDSATCTCAGGLQESDLEKGCGFDPASCEIVCKGGSITK